MVLRKYLILYVFVTKTESGGMFWRVLFNRFVFGTVLANLIVFLIVFMRGNADHVQAYAVAPLPFLMIAFKFYCSRAFDDEMHYYTTDDVRPRPGRGRCRRRRHREQGEPARRPPGCPLRPPGPVPAAHHPHGARQGY